MKIIYFSLFIFSIVLVLVSARNEHPQQTDNDNGHRINHSFKKHQTSHGNYSNSILRVTGSASTKVKQDQVTLTFKASTSGPESKPAIEYLNGILQKAIERILALGLTKNELSTSEFSVQRNFDTRFNPNTQSHESFLRSYRVQNTLKVGINNLNKIFYKNFNNEN